MANDPVDYDAHADSVGGGVEVAKLEFVAALLTSARDVDELVVHIETIVAQTVDAEQTGFYLYDEESARLRLLIYKGLTEEERRSAEDTAMERHPGKVFMGRKPLFIEDTDAEPEASRTDGSRRFKPRSRLYLPVMCHDRCVGTFGLASTRPNAFRQSHVTLLSFMCNIAGVVYGQQLASRRERAMESRLLQAQKHEAFGRLAGHVAHDFNNLLTIIIGHAELLATRGVNSAARADLNGIMAATNRASALARQLRAMSRQKTPAPVPHDLGGLVEGLRDMVGAALGREWTLHVSLPDEPLVVEIDDNEFGQALLNLVLNARDAMQDGGEVHVALEPAVLGAAVDGSAPGGKHAQLTIRDTGCGMDGETLARIFEPFFTTKEGHGGTGLGLSTVQSIVQRYSGRIEADSEPGQGSTFRVYLPCSARTPEAPVDDVPVDARPANARVLVAEDDPYLRQLLIQVIAGAGFEVQAAADGHEALELARSTAAPFDALITDLRMPNMNGCELLDAMERESPKTRAMVISGFSSDLKLQSKLRVDARYPLLWKPFTPTQLLAALERLLQVPGPG